MGIEHEGGGFRAEQIDRLHKHGPGELAVAELPGKDAHDEGLGRHGDECGRQPGIARIDDRTADEPEGQRQPQGIPEHDRHGEGQADPVARLDRVGEHRGRPVKRRGQACHRHGQHERFAPPAAEVWETRKRSRHAQPFKGHEVLPEPWRGDQHRDRSRPQGIRPPGGVRSLTHGIVHTPVLITNRSRHKRGPSGRHAGPQTGPQNNRSAKTSEPDGTGGARPTHVLSGS
jgi:hypothetical protein